MASIDALQYDARNIRIYELSILPDPGCRIGYLLGDG